MKNKLLILSSDADHYLEILRKAALPDLSIEICSEVNRENPHLQACDILFGSPDLVSQALPYARQLQWVQSMWAGVTPYMAPGMRQDYLLTGVKEIFGPVMAEYVTCHLLMHERKSLARFENQLQKKWDQTPPGSLMGKCIGIMGLGSIGSEIAKMAKLFGMETRGFSRSQRSCEGIDRCFLPDALMAFVQDLDYLVCVLPDTPDTSGLIDQAVLGAMRKTALVINVGRGNLIHEPSLVQALKNGDIAGAVLDVFQKEPLPAADPLWEAPNVIITSHTAAMSFPELVAPIFIENYQRFIEQKTLQYGIDFSRGY